MGFPLWHYRVFLPVGLIAFGAGCGSLRPIGAHVGQQQVSLNLQAADGSACLLVLLPGIGDSAETFWGEGFVHAAREVSPGCDLAIVDLHLTYYVAQQVEQRLAGDVIGQARARGYTNVWLVGISLGGYGALLAARRHAHEIDGLILIAPMMGVPPREAAVAQHVAASGGLAGWDGIRDPSYAPNHHFRDPAIVWDWLRQNLTATNPEPIVLAYGTEDRRVSHYELLAEALPARHVFTSDGAHDWPTWRSLWYRVLEARPWAEVR